MHTRWLHLHGFASSADSRKGRALRRRLAAHGVSLETPDLNLPSFSRLTASACLAHLDARLAGATRVRLSGSSMGAWLAALWAQLHPGVVDRLLLAAPAFDLAGRWPDILGHDVMRRWEREGAIEMPDGDGNPAMVHFELVADARRHPAIPDPDCGIVILHGTRDDVVPIAGSRRFAATRPHVRLVEVDDVHTLESSTDVLEALAVEHLVG